MFVCVAGEFHFSTLEGAGRQTSNSGHGGRTILIHTKQKAELRAEILMMMTSSSKIQRIASTRVCSA
jgi:hypothetical protein